MSSSFTSIPLIDLSLASSPETRPSLLRQLHHALTAVGFLYVSNHGVPESVISDLVSALPVFFSLPQEAKEEIALCNSPWFLGYSAVGAETKAGRQDRREQVEFATEVEGQEEERERRWVEGKGEGEERPVYERLFGGRNQWPSQFPALRPIVEAYMKELTALGERFLRLVAEALSLPPDTFFPFLSDQHRLKLVRYPGIPTSTSSSTTSTETITTIQGVGPHKDSSGWWTFLLQASPPEMKGLQALNRDGEWIDVPAIPGTFVVNIGQAFEVVTHGVCRATTHRVVLSPSNQQDRFSVPFFQGVRGSLTKAEAVGTLAEHFRSMGGGWDEEGESGERAKIDAPFLKGKYDTWGEAQLRTKIRSHRDVGRRFYADVYEKYVDDD